MYREFGYKLPVATALLVASVGYLWVWQYGSAIALCLLAALSVLVLTSLGGADTPSPAARSAFTELSPLVDSRSELHELQRTLCKLEIDLERDVDRLSATYKDLRFSDVFDTEQIKES